MRTVALLSVLVLGLATCGVCQEQPAVEPAPPPAVDQTDPAAVARAYLEACQARDIDGALALLSEPPELLERLRMMMRGMTEDREMGEIGLDGFLEELSLLPVGLGKVALTWAPAAEATETTATMAATYTRDVTRKVELVKGPDGRWRVDLARTITSSTGHKHPFVLTALLYERGPGGSPENTDWAARERVMVAARAVMEYAEAHGGRLPDAQTWTTDVANWCLDPSTLRRPGLGDDECGYALNMYLAGQTMPEWPTRQGTILLFEVDDPAPNLVGDPEADLAPKLTSGRAPWVAMADGQVIAAPEDVPLARLAEAWDQAETCQQHMGMLARALLAYARDHDGKLPPETSWCDDIGPYLPPEAGPSVFTCPACPDFACAYALNLALADRDVRTLSGHGEYALLVHATRGDRNEAVDVAAATPVGRHRDRWGNQGAVESCAMLNGNLVTVQAGRPYPSLPVPPPQ